MGCAADKEDVILIQKETFTNDLVQTPQQQEQDEIYGILEVRNQNIDVDWVKKQINYLEHYYYGSRGELYQKDTNLKGNFKIQGLKYLATVAGSYVYHKKSKNVVMEDVKKPAVEGTLTFERTDQGIKITQVKLTQNGTPIGTYFTGQINMKKK